jgi:regulation of enolase protein 1 (concanavalin A-like superfamily)
VVARVVDVQDVNAWTKAGVMIRQTLGAGSAHAALLVTPGKGLAFQRRGSTGGASRSTAVAGVAPYWVRLVRSGQVVRASISIDGSSWTSVGQDTIALSGGVWVGMVVSSHDVAQLARATFDHVAISESAAPR